MSAPDLLVVIDPAARHEDAEAVRIARDVLCAGSPGAKVCLPEGAEAAKRVLARRGHRHPVVLGDDRALTYAVQTLHREQNGAADAGDGPASLAFVPVGRPEALELAVELGLPTDVVTAARAVLAGVERQVGLLVDDRDVLLLGALRIPEPRSAPSEEESEAPGVLEALSRRAGLVRAARRYRDEHGAPLPRLRVEADGVLLGDPEHPVAELSVSALVDGAGAGLAEVVLRQATPPRPAFIGTGAGSSPPVRVTARAVTVSGPDFGSRTWRVARSGLRLTVPAQAVTEHGEHTAG